MKVIRLMAASVVTAALFLGSDYSLAACTTKNLGIYGPTADPLVWVLLSESYDPALESIQYDPSAFEQVRAAGTAPGGGGVVDPNIVVDPNSKVDGTNNPATESVVSTRSTTCLPTIVVTGSAPRGGGYLPVFHPLARPARCVPQVGEAHWQNSELAPNHPVQ